MVNNSRYVCMNLSRQGLLEAHIWWLPASSWHLKLLEQMEIHVGRQNSHMDTDFMVSLRNLAFGQKLGIWSMTFYSVKEEVAHCQQGAEMGFEGGDDKSFLAQLPWRIKTRVEKGTNIRWHKCWMPTGCSSAVLGMIVTFA